MFRTNKNLKELFFNFAKKSMLIRSFYHLARWILSAGYRKNWDLIYLVDSRYHIIISRFIAVYFGWIYFPLSSYCKRNSIYFSINNIPNAVGHIYPEIDYLIRIMNSDSKYQKSRALYIYPKCPVFYGFKNIFHSQCKKLNVELICSGLLHIIISPFLLRHPELTISASISSMNFSIDVHGKLKEDISFWDVLNKRLVEYAKLRVLTDSFYPLRIESNLTKSMQNLIGPKKYVVIQIKDIAINATYAPVDPRTYISMIRYARQCGYTVVFAGRERMPSEYIAEGVVNYAQSNLASVENDLSLVANSTAVISSASGFSYIADVLKIPLLTVNNWHVVAYPGANTIYIPSLLLFKNQTMDIMEQLEHVKSLGQEIHRTKGFSVQDATEEDILAGFQEILEFVSLKSIPQLSHEQIEFKNQFKSGVITIQQSRISTSFLKKNYERMICRR